jgi:hypothetical protein
MTRNYLCTNSFRPLRDHLWGELVHLKKFARLLFRQATTNTGAEAMFSIVKTALAAVIVLGSVSLTPVQALAAHRFHHHPAYAHPGAYGPPAYSFQSRDASLPSLAVPSPAQEEWFDRATQGFGAAK